MTPIEKLTPAEIVRELAVEGMGWTHSPCISKEGCGYYQKQDLTWVGDDRWDPLTDANDRDMLVDHLAEHHKIFCRIDRLVIGGYRGDAVAIKPPLAWPTHIADTPGMAVCLTAMKALRAMKETPHGK